MKTRLTLMALAAMAFAGSAGAHQQHCHIKGADGTWADEKTLTTKAACDAKGGDWAHHHSHCHTVDAAGTAVDDPKLKTRAACEKAGEKWIDHAPVTEK